MPSAPAQPRASPRASDRRYLLGFYLYLLVALALPSQWLTWDNAGFLLAARAGEVDYGHALYLPALRAARWLASPFTDAEEYSAKLLSMLGGALAFVLLWKRVERAGLRTPMALVTTLLVVACPFYWPQLSTIEPATWTLVGLLVSADAAEAYGQRRGGSRLALLTLAFALTLGLHVVSVLALPWLVWLARGPAPAPPRRELLVPVALGLLLLACAELLGDPLARLGAFLRYWRGFLDRAGSPEHLSFFGLVLLQGLPALAVTALVVLPGALRRSRSELLGPCLLGLPHVVCYLVLGKPTVGLLLPFTLALGLAVAVGVRVQDERAPRATYVVGSTLLVAQAFVSLAFALHHATTPDSQRQVATLLAGALPERALLVAGEAGHHVRWLTDAPVLLAPNFVHGSAPGGAEGALARLRRECEARLADYEAVYLSSEAIDYLTSQGGVAREELPQADASTIVVRTDPPLALFLFASRAEKSG